jgi:hypothetical protein
MIKSQDLITHGRSGQDEADNNVPDPSWIHVRWYRPAGIMTIRNSVVSTLNTTPLHHFHRSKIFTLLLHAYTSAENPETQSTERTPSPTRTPDHVTDFYRRQPNCLAITLRSLGSLTLNGPSFASIPLQSLTIYQATYLVFYPPLSSRRAARSWLCTAAGAMLDQIKSHSPIYSLLVLYSTLN